VDCRLEVWKNDPRLADVLPILKEGREAIARIGEYFKKLFNPDPSEDGLQYDLNSFWPFGYIRGYTFRTGGNRMSLFPDRQ